MNIEKIVNKVNSKGISYLSSDEYPIYYNYMCEQYGLDPATSPLMKLEFKVKGGDTVVKLYPTAAAADQLIKKHRLSVTLIRREIFGNVLEVWMKVKDRQGQEYDSMGASNIAETYKYGKLVALSADEISNAFMSAQTKAVRRGVLSMCGLGQQEKDLENTYSTTATTEPINQDQKQSPPKPTTTSTKQKSTNKTTVTVNAPSNNTTASTATATKTTDKDGELEELRALVILQCEESDVKDNNDIALRIKAIEKSFKKKGFNESKDVIIKLVNSSNNVINKFLSN